MNINSEIGKLKKVLLHKPGLALQHITPNNCHRLLFDDVLWVEKANEEHDKFEIILSHNDVEVLLLNDLLAETLEDPEAKQWLVANHLENLFFESPLRQILTEIFESSSNQQITNWLLGGLTLQESRVKSNTLAIKTMRPNDFLIPPLPNHLYMRDASCWIGNGVSINAMRYPARKREVLNLAAIYKFHPSFKQETMPIWYDGSENKNQASLEGGDLLVLNNDIVLIGISERTSPNAVETLANNLFQSGNKKKLICVELVKQRATMHLDSLITMVSNDTFVSAFQPDQYIPSWTVRPGECRQELIIEANKDFFSTLATALKLNNLNIITNNGDYFTCKREQWTDSANLLTLSPGEVIAYDRNVKMNKRLRQEGVIVHEIPSSELSRGRGGPRCMSCPLIRL